MENHATPIPQEKQCSICESLRPLALFENDKRRPDGHGPRCKDCISNKRKADKTPKALAAKAAKVKKLVDKEGWKEGNIKENSRLRGDKPGFDKFGVDQRKHMECTCGHHHQRHVEIKNPDGPGNTFSCWASLADVTHCPCRNFVSKTGGKIQ